MKITQFDAPAITAISRVVLRSLPNGAHKCRKTSMTGPALTRSWPRTAAGHAGFCNPLTHGLTGPDFTPTSAGDITWNGFPSQVSGRSP
jgi:hypothetical protein